MVLAGSGELIRAALVYFSSQVLYYFLLLAPLSGELLVFSHFPLLAPGLACNSLHDDAAGALLLLLIYYLPHSFVQEIMVMNNRKPKMDRSI